MSSTASAATSTATSSASRSVLAGPLQHVVGTGLATGGLADADADPQVVAGVEVGVDRLEPVVAGRAAADLDLDPARRAGRARRGRPRAASGRGAVDRSSMPARRTSGADGQARLVHVGLGHGQQDQVVADADPSPARARRPLLGRRRPPWRRATRSSTTSAPMLCRVPSYSAPGLPRPTTSRSHGSRPGGGLPRPLAAAEQGLALVGVGARPAAASSAASASSPCGRGLDPGRVAAHDGRLEVGLELTPAGRVMSDTCSAPPMVSDEMSMSTEVRDVGRPGLDVEGEQLLLDDAVAVVRPRRPRPPG